MNAATSSFSPGAPKQRQLAMIQQAIDRMHLPLGIALLEIDVSAGLVAVIAHGPLGAARHQIRPGAFLTTPPLLLDAALAAAQHAIDGALTLSEI